MAAVAALVPVLRWVQVPLLALFLLGACAAKVVRVVRAGSVSAGLGPSELFPRALRRPAALAVSGAELGLGASLILTARHAGPAADTARVATGLFFLVATAALLELRARRPDLGCGCFGDLSTRPVGARSVTRAALLAGAALAALGTRPPRLPAPGRSAALDLGVVAAELLLLAVLSPETSEMLVRLGYAEPCEVRVIPRQRVLALLHRSSAWRRSAPAVAAAEPSDMWRELCWWYVVYPVRTADGGEIVFAVQVKWRRPAVRVAVIEAPETGPPPSLLPAPLPSVAAPGAIPSAAF